MRMIFSFHRCKQRKLKSTETVDLKTTEYITKMTEDVEQITKTPAVESNVKTKEKDPKKVAAGKKLAEYNRKAKEALKEKMKREAENEDDRERGERQSKALEGGWIPELSFTTAISLVGIGLTAINMFMSYKKGTNVDPPRVRLPKPPIREHNFETVREQGSVIERPQQSKIPVPKMGMH